jgi:DNA-binding CsgD family transcriptional regulator
VTARELEVLHLVLGIRSRGEAVAAAARIGVLEDR